MIKPFKVHQVDELEGGVRRVAYTVKKSEPIENGIRTSSMDAVMYVDPGKDIDTYLFEELQKQGWF